MPTEEQIVAANIDVVFLVSGLDGDFNPRRIERYLVVAWESGATPVIVLNKADLVEDLERDRRRSARARAGRRRCTPSRAQRPADARRAAAVPRPRPDRRAARIVRRREVVDRESARSVTSCCARATCANPTAAAATPAPRGSSCCCPGHGVLIDTPGMRELQLWDTGEALAGTFADIEALAEQLPLPGLPASIGARAAPCARRSPPATLAAERLESFHKLADEQAYQARQQDERAQIEAEARGKIGAKALRNTSRTRAGSKSRVTCRYLPPFAGPLLAAEPADSRPRPRPPNDRSITHVSPHRRRTPGSRSAPSPRSTARRSSCTKGELLALLGPNGAGKTTLIRAIDRARAARRAARSRLFGRAARRHATRRPSSASCPRRSRSIR